MRAVFRQKAQLAPGIWRLWFEPGGVFRYEPGQFVEFSIDGDGRWFSLTSLPHEESINFVVRIPETASSFKQQLMRLEPGQDLTISDPLGDFVLPKSADIPMVWVAGGIGSAAYVGMAEQLARQHDDRNITLFQSARTAADLLFGDVWQAARITTQQAVTADSSWQGCQSRFTAADLLQTKTPDTLFYLAGTDHMVEDIARQLVARDIRPDHIIREAFSGYY